MYEIFFFDIDGTLRSFETHEVPASAREALARLRGRGAKVIIATGRDRRSSRIDRKRWTQAAEHAACGPRPTRRA